MNLMWVIRLHFALLLLFSPGCSQLALVSNAGNGIQPQDPAEIIGFAQGEVENALKPTQENRTNLLLTKAQLARANGNITLAAEALETILEVEPNHSETCRRYALIKIEQGDFITAESYLQRALEADPQNPKINNDFGYYCYLQNRWDVAEQFLIKAVTLDSTLVDAKANLGMLSARQGLNDQAREYFLAAGCSEIEIENNLTFVQKLNTVEKPERRVEISEPVKSKSSISESSKTLVSRRVFAVDENVEVAGHRF